MSEVKSGFQGETNTGRGWELGGPVGLQQGRRWLGAGAHGWLGLTLASRAQSATAPAWPLQDLLGGGGGRPVNTPLLLEPGKAARGCWAAASLGRVPVSLPAGGVGGSAHRPPPFSSTSACSGRGKDPEQGPPERRRRCCWSDTQRRVGAQTPRTRGGAPHGSSSAPGHPRQPRCWWPTVHSDPITWTKTPRVSHGRGSACVIHLLATGLGTLPAESYF